MNLESKMFATKFPLKFLTYRLLGDTVNSRYIEVEGTLEITSIYARFITKLISDFVINI